MIGIIDYGAGNLRSVYNAFRYLGEEAKVCRTPEEVKAADKIVLPGVGTSADALRELSRKGLVEPVLENISRGVPFLGICLGLQLLYEHSEEGGGCDCLGLVEGKVRLFPGSKELKVPQIGWNTVSLSKRHCPLFKGLENDPYFYFVHSYYCESADRALVAGETEYGIRYTSALWKDNVYAVQFHPERSQENGLRVIKNFMDL
ncbi:MAG: imidazole glycerol phosphate synthase subunit HisH [Candidatus Omnitrophica bacterium]|nr:imidazole glycerol phosphate synthase subunit HisH [Candidatus Omnitrophota bacterium]